LAKASKYEPRETFENLHFHVTPAKAGVQNILKTLDSAPVFTGVTRRNDDTDAETVFFKGLREAIKA